MNTCSDCCSNADGQGEFNDGFADPLKSLQMEKKFSSGGGIRQSREYSGKGSMIAPGTRPVKIY